MKSPPEPFSASPRLSVFEFEDLKRLFNEVAGLHFDDGALPLFQRRLAARLPVHELASYREYLRLLQFGAEGQGELATALDLLTSGETYFFRHQEQLALLSTQILPAVAEMNAASRRLTVWSAGCSSGEEAYTVAILLLESGLFQGWNLRIVGCDLSPERIEHARQGCYFQGAFRSTDASIRQRYFQPGGAPLRSGQTPKFWQVADEVRRLCHFGPLNLLGPGSEVLVGRAEIVLCRNVLIYLDDWARQRVLSNLYERLVPGGFLLLGHSESLKCLDTHFDLTSLPQDLAFRKPARGARRAGGET